MSSLLASKKEKEKQVINIAVKERQDYSQGIILMLMIMIR
jgi:hypothetical protein